MNDKIEMLKDLIVAKEIEPQIKLNLIIQTLQKTDDIMRAKALSSQILDGDYGNLKLEAIDNLIEAFSRVGLKENNSIVKIDRVIYEDEDKDNRTQNLEYELKTLKLQLESLEYNSEKKLKELKEKYEKSENKNRMLLTKLELTSNSELIKVPESDINELYIKYIESGETVHREAFILNDIIPKSYYKIK